MSALVMAKVGWSLLRLVGDVRRLDEVFAAADGLARARPQMLESLARRAAEKPEGRRALEERPRLGHVDVQALRAMPPGSLGRAYVDFMDAHGLSPEALPQLPGHASDAEYFRAHMYETHDLWHVVTGFAPDVVGELGLQAFYVAQQPGDLPLLLLAAGLLNTALFDLGALDARLSAIVRGYALGKRARPLFGMRWADAWATPLEEVRGALGLEGALADAPHAAVPALSTTAA